VAKLQGKVGKFALIQDGVGAIPVAQKGKEGIKEEALDVLLQLQYKKSEALGMIQEALNRNPNMDTVEDLLNEVYKQRTKK
jgi:Holliday junction resolvasome RuvABC DNA-binding subunit